MFNTEFRLLHTMTCCVLQTLVSFLLTMFHSRPSTPLRRFHPPTTLYTITHKCSSLSSGHTHSNYLTISNYLP